MFSFAHIWVFALLPLPWLLRLLLPPRRAVETSVRVPFGDRLQTASAGERIEGPCSRSLIVPSLIWLLLISALARPQWFEPPQTREQPTRDLLLLVDLSGSMGQKDFTNAAGKTVDRLSAVKEVLGEFLVHRKGDRVGLVVFGDSPFLQAPFSTDLQLSRELLDETAVGMAGPRTAFGDAIGLGINLFTKDDIAAKTIIALTDGNDTASQVPPVEAARIAADRKIRIHTVAIGDPATVGEDKLDEATLQATAKATGGRYFYAGDRAALAGIYHTLDQIETREVQVISHRPRIDLFPWPVLGALLIALGEKGTRIMTQSRREVTALPSAGSIRVQPSTGKLEVKA